MATRRRMDAWSEVDPRLRTAVDSSLHWYEAIFSLHGIPTTIEGDIWWARGQPPPWHSAAKTIEPAASRQRLLVAVEQFKHCSVADSFGSLQLSDAGFEVLFEASWLHHPPIHGARRAPEGWSKLRTPEELRRWNAEHDTSNVLLPSMLEDQNFEILARYANGAVTGGAVLHDWGGRGIGMSNEWAAEGAELDMEALLACVGNLHEGRAVVTYAWGDDLDTYIDSGFSRVGPHVVWTR